MYLIVVIFIVIAIIIRLVYLSNTTDIWMHSYCLDTRCYSNKRHISCACNLSSQVSCFRSTPHTSSFSFLEILYDQNRFLRFRLRLSRLTEDQGKIVGLTFWPCTKEIHRGHNAHARNLLLTTACKTCVYQFCCASDKTQLEIPTCSSCNCHFSCTSNHFL